MLILFNPNDGEIFYVVKTSDIPTFSHTTNIDLSAAEIPDEDDALQPIRNEVYNYQSRKDTQGQGRFFIDTSTNPPTLNERQEWSESTQ